MRDNILFHGQNVVIGKLTEDLLDIHMNLMQMVSEPDFLSNCTKEYLPKLNYAFSVATECHQHANTCPLNGNQMIYVKALPEIELLNQVQMRLPANVETPLCLKRYILPLLLFSTNITLH